MMLRLLVNGWGKRWKSAQEAFAGVGRGGSRTGLRLPDACRRRASSQIARKSFPNRLAMASRV
ncbi:MAG TPA: hypothetical protein VGR35_01470 [Tepidisphaeraceae bacterium]|nr:hypothetical protein [Tepidisphaeraceae bacterium]